MHLSLDRLFVTRPNSQCEAIGLDKVEYLHISDGPSSFRPDQTLDKFAFQ